MASTVSLSAQPVPLQGVAGTGYNAIDLRRALTFPGVYEGHLKAGDFLVSPRAAGGNMSVDVAPGTAFVQGDSITDQGLYYCRQDPATIINVDIGAPDATNPRIDRVVLEIKDDAHDASGLNVARIRVVPGTPTAGATTANPVGAAAVPSSAYLLANVTVNTTDTQVTAARLSDQRTVRRSQLTIDTSESVTNTVYTKMPTKDQLANVLLPTSGLIVIGYRARWTQSVASAAKAAIFLGSTQLAIGTENNATPQPVETGMGSGLVNNLLTTCATGLATTQGSGTGQDNEVTTGQVLGFTSGAPNGGLCYIYAAAGTYTISVQFKSSSGSVSAALRKLWVWTVEFDQVLR